MFSRSLVTTAVLKMGRAATCTVGGTRVSGCSVKGTGSCAGVGKGNIASMATNVTRPVILASVTQAERGNFPHRSGM